MEIQQAQVGVTVESNVAFCGIPLGSKGVIIEDYGTGVTVAWDLKDKPYPKHLEPETIAKMWAINRECPQRDGFDKESELQYLDLSNESLT